MKNEIQYLFSFVLMNYKYASDVKTVVN